MARQRRADEAGGIYHALNRGNRRATIFHTDEDYWAFENILSEGLERYRVEIFSYELMPNHFHLILRPAIDGEMGRFMKWVGGTHTTRYNFHYKAVGQGHVYQQRFKSFPIEDATWRSFETANPRTSHGAYAAKRAASKHDFDYPLSLPHLASQATIRTQT